MPQDKQADRTIRFGEVDLTITDPHTVMPVLVDLITEGRKMNEVVALSLATVVTDGSGPPEARICARLRMSVANAIDLRAMIDGLISQNVPQSQKN